ncbi:GGDEF domain-containing protein [Thiolapillus sp.]
MENNNSEHQRYVFGKEWLRVFILACLLFATSLAFLPHLVASAPPVSPAVLAGFFIYALFTIAAGYKHPYFGYISLDRAGQMLCLLTLGSFHAAWISGLSYFFISWLRLFRGVPLRNTINAVLINSGMMTLMMILGGYWYLWWGGDIPMTDISFGALMRVLSTLVVMQIFNQLIMYLMVYLRGGRPEKTAVLNGALIEIIVGLVGMTLALVYNRQDMPLFLLVLVVVSIGMLVMKQYASIRLHLEALVQERTHALRNQAQRDPLTGISNRGHTDEFIAGQIAHAQQTGAHLSIALLDIDHFKHINDRYLHATGDKVLQHIAGLLTSHCRSGDLVGRYGGEEFLVCFPLLDLEGARLASEKLRRLVEQEDWDRMAPGLAVTISLGVAEWQPGMRTEDLVKEADRKLYEAKSAGRNRVCH